MCDASAVGRFPKVDRTNPLPSIFENATSKYSDVSNLYSYVLNDPINRFDSTGLASDGPPASVPQMELYLGGKVKIFGIGAEAAGEFDLPFFRGTDLALGGSMGVGPWEDESNA